TTTIGGDGRRPKKQVGYSGKRYTSKKGVPTGVSIIGDNRYTSGSDTDDADEVGVEAIRSGDDQLEGRLSWEQVNPGQ
ncbi:MAG: hypothetical protein HOG53_00210, partial [Proteobacteria bacterium]|nr:hypothetical protein [Pseudomonadota bacterium]